MNVQLVYICVAMVTVLGVHHFYSKPRVTSRDRFIGPLCLLSVEMLLFFAVVIGIYNMATGKCLT